MFVFGDFTKRVHIRRRDVDIDNILFRLHYRLTFWFLLGCAVLVSSRQFIQEHINCITSTHSVERVINTFCFFSATFTIPRLHNGTLLPGQEIVAPGVGQGRPEEEIKIHAYYQWVPFVLFFQAFLFYAPHYLWKMWEKGRLSAIVNHIKASPLTADSDMVINGITVYSEDTRKQKMGWLKEVYLSASRFRVNRDWAKSLVICEVLNAVNIIFQIRMVDSFLSGNFLDLGMKWMEDDGDNVLEYVFPKVTKCTFHKYGASGTIQNHDALCVMALNIINEKIYTILWFWFMFLLTTSLVGLIWRMLTFLLHSRSGVFNRYVWKEVSPGPALKVAEIEMIATKLCFSDWLFLYYLGKNMDPRAFRKAVADLSHSLGEPSLLHLRSSDKSDLASESYC